MNWGTTLFIILHSSFQYGFTEIFKSIQGESSYAGLTLQFHPHHRVQPAMRLVRYRLCLDGGMKMPSMNVLKAIEPHHCELVEITGCEPLLQEEVPRSCAGVDCP